MCLSLSGLSALRRRRRTYPPLGDSSTAGRYGPSRPPCHRARRACALLRGWRRPGAAAVAASGRCRCLGCGPRSRRAQAAGGSGAAKERRSAVAAGVAAAATCGPGRPARWCTPPSRWREVASALDEWLGGSSFSVTRRHRSVTSPVRGGNKNSYSFTEASEKGS